MDIEIAAKKANEAGWNPSIATVMAGLYVDSFALDPQFWIALGKAEGWNQKRWTDNIPGKRPEILTPDWLAEWHRFIDHLASGKNAESFFESLNQKT